MMRTPIYKTEARNVLGMGSYSMVKAWDSKQVLLITNSAKKIEYYKMLGLIRSDSWECKVDSWMDYSQTNEDGDYDYMHNVPRIAVLMKKLVDVRYPLSDKLYNEGYSLKEHATYVKDLKNLNLTDYPYFADTIRFMLANFHHNRIIRYDIKSNNMLMDKTTGKVYPLDCINFDRM